MAILVLFFVFPVLACFALLSTLFWIWMLKRLIFPRRHRLVWLLALLSLPLLGAVLHRFTFRPRFPRFFGN